jgi:hypothetical protein
MKIYVAHPMTGLTWEEVCNYFTTTEAFLQLYGFEVLSPITGKKFDKNYKLVASNNEEINCLNEYEENALSTDKSILRRDSWMVKIADVIYINLYDAKIPPIGCLMELAWGYLLGKHTVLVLPEDSPYRHAFVLQSADIVFTKPLNALTYLSKLVRGSK